MIFIKQHNSLRKTKQQQQQKLYHKSWSGPVLGTQYFLKTLEASEIEPNSLECRFRLQMSIKIKLIVIVGVQPPAEVMKRKPASLPLGTAHLPPRYSDGCRPTGGSRVCGFPQHVCQSLWRQTVFCIHVNC